jgi:CubicO group peptidase (beta-lactamase class C family)
VLDSAHWQERLSTHAAKHGLVGSSLAVRQGTSTVTAVTGVLNLRTEQPVTADSVFQIGSITKVWTATLVLQLVDEGLLDLDAPVREYVPGFRVADATATDTVTVRQLLAHTSGIDGDLFLDTGRGDDAVERYVAAMAGLGQTHPVGAVMSYCNSGYTLLGRVVEVLRGQTWDAVLRDRLLDPLGLVAAGTLPEEALLWAAATGHLQLPGSDAPQPTPQWGVFRSAGPAGLVHCTARDVLAFAQLHLDGGVTPAGDRLLSERLVQDMQQPQVAIPDTFSMGSHWGLGWILMDWDGHRVYGHDGGTLGQTAFLRVLPDADLAVALLTNGGGNARDFFEDLFEEVFEELAGVRIRRRPEPPASPPRVEAADYVGRYVREAAEILIADTGEGLRVTTRNTGGLAALGGDTTADLVAYDKDLLLARSATGGGWTPLAFFDLDADRYLHTGGRAVRRVAAR